MRRTILEAARSGPVCLFLDDLDGCRATSWRMLEWIASTVDDSRLLLVVAARDAGAATPPERREAIGGLLRISGARRESLPPLSRGEVRAVAEAALGSEPSTRRVRELHSRSGGNPFLLHTLLAGRAPCALRSQRSALEDSSLRRAVAAHLEVVGAEARAWLRRAAVLGRDFDLALLAAICEETISEIRQAMVPAREAGVLETRANGRSLRFRHGLLAEVACAEVTDRERERIRRLARELRSAPGYLRSLPTLRVPATSTDAH